MEGYLMSIGHQIIGTGHIKVIVHHGWLMDSSVWNWAKPHLNKTDFSYAFLDYRGYGLSRNIAGDITIPEMAYDGLELANYLGWEKFHVLGHSMGGAAAQYTAGVSTGQVKSIAAFTPVASTGFPLDEVTKTGLENSFNKEGLANIFTMVSGHELDQELLNTLVEYSMDTIGNENVYKDYFNNWIGANFKNVLSGSEVPAFTIVGATDPLVTKEYADKSIGNDFSNCNIQIMEGVGHYPIVEKPLESVKLWEDFFQSKE
jgi:pimeloyl-ACP methyl ester carboxylesterase